MESVAAAAAASSSSSSYLSGSSSTPPPPPPPHPPSGEYEVFLSFRGPDVRNTFADHLYSSLSRTKIRTFRDAEELPKGEQISLSLIGAIGESKIYIPIFTENYASSKWCLQELAHMVECWKQGKGHLFLPIFYFVDPRNVRHQEGPFEQAFEQHAQKHNSQTVEEWKEALRMVGNMKGWHVTESDGQGAIIDEILSKVELHLRSNYPLVTDELVGIDTRVEEVMKLLNLDSDNPRVIGIHGMGGIGKTTISKAVYNQIYAQFDRCCFLEDVRETLTRSDGVVSLQNKFISNVLKGDYQVRNASEGINLIKRRVCRHKILLVFDDVDDKFDFHQTLGKFEDFSLESRFIFTTRDKRVSVFFDGCKLYEVGEMSRHYSVQLFSKHAFGTDHPPEDYVALTETFVNGAVGLPLALKVFGSLLLNRDRKFWEEKLKTLQDIPSTGDQVQKRLKISYDELTHDEKQIFLDIACCFIGKEKELPYHMWSSCNFHPESGITTLVLRSLVKLDEQNKFWMHDHVRDLGRAIVKEEDIHHPYKRSRIWSNEDALDLLRNKKGNDRVEVLMIEMGLEDDRFTNMEFKELSNLRYLKMWKGRMTGDFSKILPNIRMLQLHRCESISADFNMDKLAILDMEYCNVKDSWKGWKRLQSAHKLKSINLQSCFELKRAPDLSRCVSLESINVENCYFMKGPLHIDNCKNLKTLKFGKTEITELTGDIKVFQQLEEINAVITDSVGIETSKFMFLASKYITVPYQMEVSRLPTSLKRLSISSQGGIPNLIELKDLEYLGFFKSHQPRIPRDIWRLLPKLKELILWESPLDDDALLLLETLPSSLTRLVIVNCGTLRRLPSLGNLNNLKILKLGQFEATKILGLGELRALEVLEISHAPNLNNFDGLENLLLLVRLRVKRCGVLEKMPSLANLIKLQGLEIDTCEQLKEEITGLERLVLLESLIIRDCTSIRKLPLDLSELKKLENVNISSCRNLIDVTGIGRLESLQSLNMSDCSSIKELPDLSGLKNLEYLYMSGCSSMKELGNLSSLKNLMLLNIKKCTKITQVNGLEELWHLMELQMDKKLIAKYPLQWTTRYRMGLLFPVLIKLASRVIGYLRRGHYRHGHNTQNDLFDGCGGTNAAGSHSSDAWKVGCTYAWEKKLSSEEVKAGEAMNLTWTKHELQ